MTRAIPMHMALAFLLIAGSSVTFADPLADPTRPFSADRASPVRAAPEFTVTAVINASSRRVAVVNGVVVQAGGRVGDARILEILPDGVRFERHGRQFTTRIASLAVRVRTPASTTRTAKSTPVSVEPQEVSP
jgi:hypothetical protein